MSEAEGRVVLQSAGRCCYGRVRVRYLNEQANELSEAQALVALSGGAWPPAWVEAAVTGAALGLQLSGASGRCEIVELHNPEIPPSTIRPWCIALAAVRAVWAAVEFVPDQEAERKSEEACALPEFARGHIALWHCRLE